MKKVEEMRRIGKGPGRKFFFFSLFESRSFWKSFVNKGMENRYLFLCLRVSFIIRGRYLTERTSFLHTQFSSLSFLFICYFLGNRTVCQGFSSYSEIIVSLFSRLETAPYFPNSQLYLFIDMLKQVFSFKICIFYKSQNPVDVERPLKSKNNSVKHIKVTRMQELFQSMYDRETPCQFPVRLS